MIDLGGLRPAIPAGPAIPVQDGTTQQRVDPALPDVVGGGVPVKKG